MLPTDAEPPAPAPADGEALSGVEQDLLVRVRDVAQQINERVRKALGDEPREPPPDPDEKSTPLP